MIYREYGLTGVKVSALGFGGMRFRNTDDAEACAALVKACHDAGITYFDTAIGYGKSEEVMGLALREMNKTRAQRPFYVSTKTFGATGDAVRRDLETSLKRLQLDYVDFYHMWCILNPEAFAQRKDVLRTFERLRDEGLIRHVCVSSHMAGSEIGAMLRDYPFEGVLLGYSAMNFAFREEGVAEAARLRRGVVAMNPLGGGIIPQHPERFDFVRARPDETVVDGALRFLFDDPRIAVTLVGMRDLGDLQAALKAMEGFTPRPPETRERMRAAVRVAFDQLCTGCRYCDSCPQDLPIPRLMDAYNQFMLSGELKDIVNRLDWHWGILNENNYLDRCTECGACEAVCTQKLPIIRRLKEIRAEVERHLLARQEKAK